MRKVIYAMSVSLDGFVEATDGDIGWSAPDEELHRHFNDMEKNIDVHLYGRLMYEIMAGYWPKAAENPTTPKLEIEYARIWKDMKKIVFSRTLKKVDWNSRLVSRNISEEASKLKSQPGNDLSVSGAGIAASFMELGLIDEYRLYVHPIILGGGKPMFPHLREKINLKLVESKRFSSGVVLLRLVHQGAT